MPVLQECPVDAGGLVAVTPVDAGGVENFALGEAVRALEVGGAQGLHDASARLAVGARVGLGRGALLVLRVSGERPCAVFVDCAFVAGGLSCVTD